ncbi:MAG TPA: porin [Gallionellaceae bacterium]|nr:porin [Gallionellaceae bacterium]
MQKKIIVLALAAAFAAPAFADTANVNIYGAVNMSVESINNGDSAAGAKGSVMNKVSSNTTKLGFKGTQDLGDGVSAIWQIEQQIDGDNSGGSGSGKATFATRNTFVGLSDKALGTVQLGKMDTPYKASTRSLDAFGDMLADNRSLMGGVKGKSAELAFDGRDGDVVAYTSPEMGGVTLAAAYVMGAEQNSATTVNQGSATSLAAMYKAGDLSANLGYEVHNYGTAASGTLAGTAASDGQKETAMKLGVGYKLDALYLSAIYEKTSDSLAAGLAKYDHNAWNVAAKYDLSSNNTVKLSYTKASEINNIADTGATQLSAGFDHKLAKTTSVYALYTVLTNGDAINYVLADAGSTGGAFTGAGNGSKVSAMAAGVKHAF